jgi:hypothetical protein
VNDACEPTFTRAVRTIAQSGWIDREERFQRGGMFRRSRASAFQPVNRHQSAGKVGFGF